jgi:hypothetical protein
VGSLVGWTGTLTPKFGALADGATPEAREVGEPPAVELAGDGRVLLEGAAA